MSELRREGEKVMINRIRSVSTGLMVTLLLLLTSCAVGIKENMKAMHDVTQPKTITDDISHLGLVSKTIGSKYPKLEAAYWQVTKGNSIAMKLPDTAEPALKSIWNKPEIHDPLPSSFAGDPLVKKMIITSRHALLKSDAEQQSITRDDLVRFTSMLSNNFGGNRLMAEDKESTDAQKSAYKLAQGYLCAYFMDEKNGFVDRDGTKYMAPEFKGKVENATITALVGIIWEAIADDLFQTPIWVTDDGKYVTKGGNEPTARKMIFATTGRDISERVVKPGEAGIEENKIKVMRFLSGLAGDQSKTLSGMAYKFIGKVNLHFVIGAGFSFGDNDTLAKVLDTSFEVVSRRITVESSRHLLEPITYTAGGIAPENEGNPAKKEALKLLQISEAIN
jgi:hypothetical protein